MSTATATRTNTAAATVADSTPTPDAFRAALAALSVASDTTAEAKAALASISLARYTAHATKYAADHKGVSVLPESSRRDVAALVWLEATGHITSPAAADRTPGETSLGQYISRYGTVATDLAHGMAYLAGPDSVSAAYAAISETKRDGATSKRGRAFAAYLTDSLTPDEAAAVKFAISLFGGLEEGKGDAKEHAAAFVAAVKTATVPE